MEKSSIATKTVLLIVLALASSGAEAFAVPPVTTVSKADAPTQLNALYQNWIPRTTAFADVLMDESKRNSKNTAETVASSAETEDSDVPTTATPLVSRTVRDPAAADPVPSPRGSSFWAATAAAALVVMAALPQMSLAVSGGGLDFAGLDISNQDFSNGNYKGKDFTQVLARNTNFAGSNLVGCRFPKAYLINANYQGADIRGVSFEGTNLENANLKVRI